MVTTYKQTENPFIRSSKDKALNFFSRNNLLVDRRKKVSIVDIAEAYKSEIENRGLTQKQLADELGISRVRVTQILNVLKLPDKLLNRIRLNPDITERKIRGYSKSNIP